MPIPQTVGPKLMALMGHLSCDSGLRSIGHQGSHSETDAIMVYEVRWLQSLTGINLIR